MLTTFFFYLRSFSTLDFLWTDYRHQIVVLIVALGCATAAATIIWKLDQFRLPRIVALIALLIGGVIAWLAASYGGKPRSFLAFGPSARYVAIFYSSWTDVVSLIADGRVSLLQASPASGQPIFKPQTSCEMSEPRPDVILIHEESLVPPEYLDGLSYDHRLDHFFRSYDGQLRKLGVETFGGGSWLTEFSILSGISTYSFGSIRHFVQPFMQDRLKEAITETFQLCGYKNSLFYPALKNFVVNAKFYDSIGLNNVFDKEDQKADSYYMRDRFYFSNAIDYMSHQFQNSNQPLFTYIQTMSPHGPYDWKFAPEMEVPGGGNDDPDMNEYLRRLWIAETDYEFFRGELQRRFPDRQFLIVHYGDHHPLATRPYLGLRKKLKQEEILPTVLDTVMPPDSIGSMTYFAIDTLNYSPPKLATYEVLDVPYLGTTTLMLAGLPLSDAQKERVRIMKHCNGRYYSCKDQALILDFHRRLTDSGIIDLK